MAESAQHVRDQEPAQLRLRMLGGWGADAGGEVLVDLGSGRARSLVAHLVLGRAGPCDRSELAFLLWPDSTDAQARTNLRHLIFDLRRALPDTERYLAIDSRFLQWRRDAPADVDLVAFEEAIERARRSEDPVTTRRALEEAAARYGGDLLPSCYEDWIAADRLRLHNEAVAALEELANLADNAGDRPAAIAALNHLVQLDPVHEVAYQRLIELHAAAGDRGRALRAYHSCVTALNAGIGVVPSAATTQAYESLLHTMDARGAPDTPRQVERSVVVTSSLTGRVNEFADAVTTWRHAVDAGARMLLVSGEPGIGKSRLLDELARAAERDRAAVARSRCFDVEGTLALGPVADWLRATSLRAGVADLDDAIRADMARLVPDVAGATTVHPEIDTDVGVYPEQRERLFHALASGCHVADRPVLLVVDDLQWCDPDTLAFIHYLLRVAAEQPLLIAGSVRLEEVADDDSLQALRARLQRDGRIAEIRLEALDPLETAELGQQLAGRELGPDVIERLVRETEGNPLFVVEALRAGLADNTDDTTFHLTPTMQAVIRSRLDQLSPDARTLIDLGATIGRAFSVDVLAAAVDDQTVMLAGLDELWRRRVIREQSDNDYDFSHDKIREVAYGMISPVRRRHLHRTAATALATVHADSLGPISATLATHYERAGLLAEAIDAYRSAAAYAQQLYANDDTISALERALSLLPRLPADDHRVTLELDLRAQLGAPLVAKLGYGAVKVRENYTRARHLSERAGVPTSPPILRGLGLASLVQCRFDESGRRGKELLQLANEGPGVERTEGHYLIGVTSFWKGRFDEAREHLEAAMAAYEPERRTTHMALFAQDPAVVCGCRLAFDLWYLGFATQARELMHTALETGRQRRHPLSIGYACCYAAMLAIELDDDTGAAAVVEEGRPLWVGQLAFFAPMARVFDGWLGVRDGNQSAMATLDEGVAGWRDPSLSLHLTWSIALLARAHLDNGDAQAALDVVAKGQAHMAATGQRYIEVEFDRIEAEARAALGQRESARKILRRAIDNAIARHSPKHEITAAVSLARITGFDDPTQGAAAHDRLGAALTRFPEPDDLAIAREAEALLRVIRPGNAARNA